MRTWMRRVHIWVGLLACIAMLDFGAAGLATAWHRTPWSGGGWSERRIPFEVPETADDPRVAELVRQQLRIPFSRPLDEGSLQRDAEGRLTFTFFTVNADHKVTVLPGTGELSVRTRTTGPLDYLSRMHALTPHHEQTGDWRLVAWSWFVELTIYAVLLLPLTGVYLWLVARRDDRWALLSFAAGVGSFVAFWLMVR